MSPFTRHFVFLLTRCLAGAVLTLTFVAISTPAPARAATSPVEAELIIPPAATHVIGDHTPLIWRFQNQSSEPLAFMWEGCCRLNGRLTVNSQNQVTPVPPTAALAHMFAKAERLEPGRPADFETRLSDWVQLSETGTYELIGRYVGVLPEQTPQVPRGLNLWRETAITPPLEIQLLSVPDYLTQSTDRSNQRGLLLHLSGPSTLPPLQPTPLTLELHNLSPRPQEFTWPHDFQLWIVDHTGRRLGNVPTSVEGTYQNLVLPPGSRRNFPVPFHSTMIEGEPFGAYQVFIDLRAGPNNEPRLPSNAVQFNWHLGEAEVRQVLQQAAAGSRIALRNAPLKLLRVYVGEIGKALAAVDVNGAPPALLALRDQLQLASCLKAFSPIPGKVDLPLTLTADGRSQLAEPRVTGCLTSQPQTIHDAPRLQQLLNVRRHLGWEIQLSIHPAPHLTLNSIQRALEPYRSLYPELGSAPHALLHDDTTNAPIALTFRSDPIATEVILQVQKTPAGSRWAAAQKPAPTIAGSALNLFHPNEILTTPLKPVNQPAEYIRTLEPRIQPLIIADSSFTWSELLSHIEPLIQRRTAIDLLLLSP